MDKNGLYGYFAGMTTAAILQPFDNIKMALMLPPKDLNLTNNFIRNIYKSVIYLANDEGFRSFYRGLIPNVAKTGFSSAIYFSSLRICEKISKQNVSDQHSFFYNFLSSSIGRIASAVASNPLGIIQTRFQIAGKQRWSGSVIGGLRKLYAEQGIKGYFKGGLTSCYKQGSFAGIFYALYQEGKLLKLPSFVSGIGSGLLATLITHPFQIIRAQIQTRQLYCPTTGIMINVSIKNQLTQLIKTGQAFKGVTPRLVKKPLSNTIAFLIFQKMEDKTKKE